MSARPALHQLLQNLHPAHFEEDAIFGCARRLENCDETRLPSRFH
jgi:hypothetical protein